MCKGCCRYAIDIKISKILLIGKWLVRWNNCEIGGLLFPFFAWLWQDEVTKCEKGWEEFFREEQNEINK